MDSKAISREVGARLQHAICRAGDWIVLDWIGNGWVGVKRILTMKKKNEKKKNENKKLKENIRIEKKKKMAKPKSNQ